MTTENDKFIFNVNFFMCVLFWVKLELEFKLTLTEWCKDWNVQQTKRYTNIQRDLMILFSLDILNLLRLYFHDDDTDNLHEK